MADTEQIELPAFEGEKVVASAVKVTKAGDGLDEALEIEPQAFHMEAEVGLVLTGTVTQINHRRLHGKLVRVHTIVTSESAMVPVNIAWGLISSAAERLRKLRDERNGQTSIDDQPPGPLHVVDGAGVVTTPADADPFGSDPFDGEDPPSDA